MSKILLYGVGSYKNRGVEAIVKSTINQIGKDDEITVASLYNSYNKEKYQNQVKKYMSQISSQSKITDTYSKDRKELYRIQKGLIEEIKNQDILISCGGDNYCYNASEWLYTIDEEVKKQNKKLILWGASLFDEINDVNLINDMNLFDILYIRESISYDAIKRYVDEKKLILCADPAFSLKPQKIKLDDWYQDRKIVGLNFSPFTIDLNKQDSYNALIKLMKYILRETEYSINLIPHVIQKESNDMTILKKLKEEFKKEDRVHLEKDTYDCSEIKYIISKCDLLIASRTHASIAGYSQMIPTLVIGYSVKSKGIAKDIFGTYDNYVVPYKELNTDNIVSLFKWLDKNKEAMKEQMNKVIPKMVKKSSKIFSEIMDKLAKNEQLTICEKRDCIGCGVCYKSCPQHAINFVQDDMGFYYPQIDLKKCNNCNLCRKNCPIKNKIKSYTSKESYACKATNTNIQEESSSGGFFSTLAKSFINELKGVVYGATVQNNKTKHIRITKENELKKISGSKYTQSSLVDVIDNIKKDIKDNKKILFSGTPCQIAAIRMLVKDYKDIYYAAVICHGVMNDTIVDKILEKKKYPKNTKVLYHRKDYAWDSPTIKLITNSSSETLLYQDSDLMNLYLNNVISRYSCYDCQYKGKNNAADIVMGDYWGVGLHHPNIYDQKGVSAIIIKSSHGKELLEKLKIFNQLISEKSNYKWIVECNPLIEDSVEMNLHRYKILEQMESNSIELISNNIKLIVNNNNLTNEIEQRDKRYEYLQSSSEQQILELKNQLESIVESKRWKIANGISDKIKFMFGKLK